MFMLRGNNVRNVSLNFNSVEPKRQTLFYGKSIVKRKGPILSCQGLKKGRN